MAKISVLAPQVANMIAAGEVVERPASAVKELIENAVDAGADAVTVEIRQGGAAYIRVTDNGCGMDSEDAQAAFLRHATSKIRYEGDLNAIRTLGFRGEALAAIAAVSKIDLFTKPPAAPTGFHVAVEGGEIVEAEETGCPDGTTVVVKDLFYNTPARMKFRKKDSTEAAYVEAAAEGAALARPSLSVKLIKDGKEGLYTPGDGNMLSALYAVYGRDFTRQLAALSGSQRDVQAGGYISRPSFSRANRGMQSFFVNGRPVRSKLLTAAVDQAYQGRLTGGRFPACFLSLRVSPSAVDVNVHPAKLEVKFAREREVFSAVYQFITAALDSADPLRPEPETERRTVGPTQPEPPRRQEAAPKTGYRPRLFTFPEGRPQGGEPLKSGGQIPYQTKFQPAGPGRGDSNQPLPPKETWTESTRAVQPAGGPTSLIPEAKTPVEPQTQPDSVVLPEQPEPRKETPEFRVIGEIFSTYILVQTQDSLVMIDKHAAHERMIYNRLRQDAGGGDGQTLLTPQRVSLSRREKEVLLENASLLLQAGFAIEDFGQGALMIRQTPMYLEGEDIGYVLSDIAGQLLEGKTPRAEAYEKILKSVACKAAVKAGGFTSPEEQENFVARLLADPQVRSCPHGRPTLFVLSQGEIEKQFKRTL